MIVFPLMDSERRRNLNGKREEEEKEKEEENSWKFLVRYHCDRSSLWSKSAFKAFGGQLCYRWKAKMSNHYNLLLPL
jgi:hypothetical protein